MKWMEKKTKMSKNGKSYKLLKNKITFEEKITISLSKDLINKYDLRDKTEISGEDYRKLIRESIENYTIYLLAKKDYFKKDLSDKLYGIYREKNIVSEVLDLVEEKGYIDDFSRAKNYIDSHKNYGSNKLSFELMRRGINKDNIKELLGENEDAEYTELERIIEKQKKDKTVEKLIQSLMRKGFEYKKIKMVLERGEK